MTKEINRKRKKVLSPLKWAGSKRWCSDLITEFWKANEKSLFVEPFAGAIASTLSARPKKAILNDINPHLINFYKQVQKGLDCNLYMKNEEAFYYEQRARFNVLIELGQANTKEAALLFYYLNRTGYNGLCRFAKRKGNFNVPFGRHKTINYRIDFLDIQEAIKDYDFTSIDFEKMDILSFGEDVFTFFDSPYHKAFSGYSKEDFDWDDQVRLIQLASKLKGPVLMTNNATEQILEELEKNGFSYKTVMKKHTVGPTSESRKVMKEVFAWKNMIIPEEYAIELKWENVLREKNKKEKTEKKVKK